MAEAWVVLQVAYRTQLGIKVDYKEAQREGKWFHSAIVGSVCDLFLQQDKGPWMLLKMLPKLEAGRSITWGSWLLS